MIEKIRRTFSFILNHKLARTRKFESLKRFVLWQIQTAISSKRYYKKPFASKLTVLVTKGQTGMTGNLYTGLHEFEKMGFLLHFLRGGEIFVDAGANVGSYSLLASGLVSAKTFAFEPIPSTFKNLNNNVRINGLGSMISSYNMGLASKDGFLTFSIKDDTTNHVLTDSSTLESINVPVSTLDEILKDNCPSLMKIDVEGYETEVLNGSSKILSNITLKAIIIELNGSGDRYGFNDIDIHNKLLAQGFTPAEYDPLTRNIHLKESFGNTNTIYVRDLDFINDRVRTSKLYRIFGVDF